MQTPDTPTATPTVVEPARTERPASSSKIDMFAYQDYKKYMNDRLRASPALGRGILSKMSVDLSIPLSTFSQVFRGNRHLTLEQAIDVAHFLNFEPLEAEYFLALVERARAGNERLRSYSEVRVKRLKKISQSLYHRISAKSTVENENKHVFYSDWIYSAVRLLTSAKAYQTPETIAQKLKIAQPLVKEALDFLVSAGLCVLAEGKYSIGPSYTHLSPNDPLVLRHLQNWRLQTMRRLAASGKVGEHEICASLPCTMDKESIKEIREILMKAFMAARKRLDTAKPEELVVINLDLLVVGDR